MLISKAFINKKMQSHVTESSKYLPAYFISHCISSMNISNPDGGVMPGKSVSVDALHPIFSRL